MKNINYYYRIITPLLIVLLLISFGCSREIDELEPASFPTNGDVFIDGFSGGLQYNAFGNVTTFSVEENEVYDGTASMRFAIPDAGNPNGSFAGGSFFAEGGRDLSGYTTLSFWAKASRSAAINEIAFGDGPGGATYKTTINNLAVNTNWKKYYIPIPDPSKLTKEGGLFFYVEEPENGEGYTFWIDEVQFEDIGTIAYRQAGILDGQTQEFSRETGESFAIEGAYAVFNLPTGIDQRVETKSSYFTFTSSNPNVATVNSFGVVTILEEGTTEITAKLRGVDAAGKMIINSSGEAVRPVAPAPNPTEHPDSVISLFSNVYNDVPVDTWNPFWEGSTTFNFDLQIDGDDVKQYKTLNFVGIEFTSQRIDASEMTHFHIDIWTPNPTDLPTTFKIELVDFGADGGFDGGDDSAGEAVFQSPTLVSEQWVSLDIPLSSLPSLSSRTNMAQLILSGDIPNVFIDNVYFYNTGEVIVDANIPSTTAPAPTENASDVISLFSNAYDDVPVDTWNPFWEFSTTLNFDIKVNGDDIKQYKLLNFVGIEFVSQQINVSEMTHFHMDIWTPSSTNLPAAFGIELVDFGPDGGFDGGDDSSGAITFSSPTLATKQWVSLDIPLISLPGLVNKSNLAQLILSGDLPDVFVDNVYFYKSDGVVVDPATPTTTAPAPTEDASDVISLFSNAYNDVPVDTWNPFWEFSTALNFDIQVNGDDIKQYKLLNFVGIEFVSQQIDATDMTHFHLDIWTPESINPSSEFKISLVDFGADGGFDGGDDSSHELTFTNSTLATGQWISLDIPLSNFAGLTNRTNMAQLVLSGNIPTINLDNVYFHKGEGGDGGGGGGGDNPTTGAPEPIHAAADVISVFSDSYMNIAVEDLNPNWGQATVTTEQSIGGNNTLVYKGLNYQGLQLLGSQDVSGMNFLHLDFWTANSTALNVFTISPGPVETPYILSVPTSGWVSVDIPLSDFSPVDFAELIQFKFDGNGDIYLDNLYFHK
ncbi:MAG: hypothetical protein AB8B69_15865 [Chitinophagales bacterium]